jgi:hypothetical protein
VYVIGPAAFPTSPTTTQYVPAEKAVPLSWAVAPGGVTIDPFVSIEHAPVLLGVPTPRPIVIVGGGPADTSVTLMLLPLVVIVKLCESTLPTCTVPVNVSVTSVPVEETMFEDVSLPPQDAATAISTTANAGAAKRFILDVSQLVTDTSNGEDIPRIAVVIGLDAPPEPADQRIDASHRDEPIVTPDQRQQPVTTEYDAGMRGENIQQVKFLFRQLHPPALDAHVPPGRINLDVSMADGWRSRRSSRGSILARA